MRTSIASLTLMAGLCVFTTSGTATIVKCPETSSIPCGTPSPVVVDKIPLYKTTCSSGDWKGSIASAEDKKVVPDGSPTVSVVGLTPACNYPIKGPSDGTTEYIALLNPSLQDQNCTATDDLKEFNCSGS